MPLQFEFVGLSNLCGAGVAASESRRSLEGPVVAQHNSVKVGRRLDSGHLDDGMYTHLQASNAHQQYRTVVLG